jgi:hypothetical protein
MEKGGRMMFVKIDEKKFARLRKEAQMFQDDIVCAVGTDFMKTIAEAENRMIFDILKGIESESAEPEVKHGEWISARSGRRKVCSCCESPMPFEKDYNRFIHLAWYSNFCPNCGAKMDGERSDT